MTSNEIDDFENDWTFVDSEGKVDIEPRKNSVSYSKPLSARDEIIVSPTEVPDKDDSEGEAEFEVLSGFQCHLLSMEELASTQDVQNMETNEQSDENSVINGEKLEDQLVPVQQNSCQCAAADGIMIISNHFCLNDNTDSSGNDDVVNPVALECEQDCIQENLPSHISKATADGWENPPQLSESGSYSFPSDSNSSEEDNDIEPIPEDDSSQDFVELSHDADTLDEVVDSKHSLLSFDSDLCNPSDLDEGVGDGEDYSDIVKLSETGENHEESDQDEGDSTEKTEDCHVTTDNDNSSSVYFDVPTLFVLLGITTALGFSIGYGLSVYVSSQALEVSRNIKRPGPKTASLPLGSDSMEPLDDVSRDFLDQLTMWKIEDRLDSQRDPEPENELGDLFDTKALHEKLQQKHFKLMSLHDSVKQRLRMSRVMSWYWRLKYEEEKSKKEGDGEWSKALQEQLQHMEQLYLHEKHTADLWRRMNENAKLRRAVANGIKFDKYWKDFLSRWKKAEDRSPVNESQKLTHPSEVDENPDEKELRVSKGKELGQNEHSSSRVRESMWREFRDRWTKDLQLKGRKRESSSKTNKCASDDSIEKNHLSGLSGGGSLTKVYEKTKISPWYPPIFMENLVKKSVKDTSMEPDYREDDKVVTSLFKHNAQTQDNDKEISKEFTKGPQFDNPLFPREYVSWFQDKTGHFLKADHVEQVKMPADKGTPRKTYLEVYWCPKSSRELEKVPRESLGTKITSVKKTKADKKRSQKVVDRSFVSYRGRRKGGKESAVQTYGALTKTSKISWKDDANVQLQQLLSEQKQMLRNLSKDRGEEIRKHRIQRRELKKVEKEAKLRVEEADRYLLELKQERRHLEIEKTKLRRSWKALKRSKEKFSVERELHEKDKQGLEKFTAALKQEKKKLKKLKERLKKMKELLAKQSEVLKLKKKSLDANNREVERLRNEIAKEKSKLRKQQKVLKSLKKAAKEKYKKWSRELRRMKTEKKKERKMTEQAKERKEAKKKWEREERERQRKQEYESVVREQAKYDKEKRRRKGESGETRKEKITKGNWKRSDDNTRGKEYEQSKGSQAKTEGSYRKAFFKQQLEKVQIWLSRVREKTLERQQKAFSQMESLKQWLSSVHKKTLKKAEEFQWRTLFTPSIFGANRGAETPRRNPDEQDELQEQELKRDKTSKSTEESSRSNGDSRKDHSKPSYWEVGKKDLRKLMFGIEKRECERKEKEQREMTVRNSELARVSKDRALAGFANLTFDVDLVKTLLKGLVKVEREDKTAGDDVRAADSRPFIIISKELDDIRSGGDCDVKKKMDKNLKCPKGHPWMPQGSIESELGQVQDEDWSQQETPEGPIPPEGIRLSSEEWYEKRHKLKGKRQKGLGPRGPVLSDVRSGDARDRHRGNFQDKVCTSDDTEKKESIPPPDWVFQRARERAKERAVPWYDMRAQSRNFQRSVDEHNTQFPCGHNWEPQEDEPTSTSWYDQRAQDRCYQRHTDTHDTQFLSDKKFQHRKDQRSVPWYDRRAQERDSKRSTDKHETQFPCGQKRKRGQNWFYERASDRAHQRSNSFPWYFRRAERRESQHREELEPWFLRSGHYREHFQDWMPQGPSMDEHCRH